MHGITLTSLGSFEQLYSDETKPYFIKWIDFCCDSFSRPARDLLQDLQNIDLASIMFCQQVHGVNPGTDRPFATSHYVPIDGSWAEKFSGLRSWVGKYVCTGFLLCFSY